MEQTLKSKVDFPESKWAGVSDAAKDLIKNLLKKNSLERLDGGAVLAHSWFDDIRKDMPPAVHLVFDAASGAIIRGASRDPSVHEADTREMFEEARFDDEEIKFDESFSPRKTPQGRTVSFCSPKPDNPLILPKAFAAGEICSPPKSL
jgi:hypothetical protein